jgi:hypothetical protein
MFRELWYHQVLFRFRGNPYLIHNGISCHTAHGSAVTLLRILASLHSSFCVLLEQMWVHLEKNGLPPHSNVPSLLHLPFALSLSLSYLSIRVSTYVAYFFIQ